MSQNDAFPGSRRGSICAPRVQAFQLIKSLEKSGIKDKTLAFPSRFSQMISDEWNRDFFDTLNELFTLVAMIEVCGDSVNFFVRYLSHAEIDQILRLRTFWASHRLLPLTIEPIRSKEMTESNLLTTQTRTPLRDRPCIWEIDLDFFDQPADSPKERPKPVPANPVGSLPENSGITPETLRTLFGVA